MSYTPAEVMQYIKEEDVKFIRLVFCDIFGRPKNISVMPRNLPRAFDTGIAIDASAVAGFGGEIHSDLFLRPETATLSILPWRPEHGRVVRMLCDIYRPDGRPFEGDVRYLLKKTNDKAASFGYRFFFGSEFEFYLFKEEEGERHPLDNAGYMDMAPEDKGENVRREICFMLERMGIFPESSHHEEGPGQNEIDFRYADPLCAADNAVTFCTVVKTIADACGLSADFSPKPLKDASGNGLHINMSVQNNEENAMSYMMAGVLEKIADMTLFLNPTHESYQRLGSHKAPRYISWSQENRSQLLRVPAAEGESQRFELRSPDPMANPYLAFTLLIEAASSGLKRRLELPEAKDINLYTASPEELATLRMLPQSLAEAAKAAADSEFIRSVLPEQIIRAYCNRQ